VSGLDLATALAPLHRAYLRRLDQMAARLPAEALLRESTSRGPTGGLMFGLDGLPLVFDVADARSLETFEVRGGTVDAPAAAGGRFGQLEVELLPGNWEALPLHASFELAPNAPSDAEVLELAELVRAWALIASQGGFARADGDPAPWSGRLHSMKLEAQGATLIALLDLGTCPPAALEVLLSALQGLARDGRAIAKVRLGGAAEEPAAK
jgi:hypothetical protein